MKSSSKNNKNKKNTQTKTYVEYSTPNKIQNFSFILKKISDFFIYFSNNNDIEENNDNEPEKEQNNKKIKLKKSSIKRIFNMLKIPYTNISPYIEISFSYVKSETVTNTITTFNIDYKSVMKIVDIFFVLIGNEEEDIEINKKSINKIFNLLELQMNERLNLMQFYEVDEDIIYEEEEEEEEKEALNANNKKYTQNKKKKK